MGDWTGTVPTFLVGKLYADDMDTMADIDTALVTAWTTWTPTLTNLTLGSGTVTAKYRRFGKTVDYRFKFVFGAGSAVGTSPQFTLPVNLAADYYAVVNSTVVGFGVLLDSGTATRQCHALPQSATTLAINTVSATAGFADITTTSPWTWTTNDSLFIQGTYEAA